MRKIITMIAVLLAPTIVLAAGSSVPLDKANYDLTDKASLQTGAQLFINYCAGCHGQQYQRYQRTFDDLQIPYDLGQQYLQITGEKVGEHMVNAMPSDDGAQWFGAAVPDLTLVARVRGADWLYTYLRSFYADPNRPFGVNNSVFPDVGMPHVLEPLQGLPAKTYETRLVDGQETPVYVGLKTDGSGQLSTAEYDAAVLDLVNYLVYTGEPTRLESEAIGRGVLIFILVFFVLAYLLKKEYWRDVH
jgi:ubiquinol-cytochrome c reductase cytochrome c1 subunit